ncbi:DUF4118 domain-containing protein [Streptomyces sp. NPDC059122]|uniref:DUF4118 domain-containing protein n=1 Tax=unclassified Streptomyces TaxID=2593676 RepID=UPI00367DF211
MSRGRLRVYLGAAPGVGKSYAMLAEGQRRRGRGTDVVIGLVEPHGRRLTAQMAEGLELVPRRTLAYRGREFTEMDLGAVLARRPQVALVDELAHTNVPGSRNEKRWQDVEELLDAGIDVVSTLNIQHLASLNDVVEQITGVRQAEMIPDEVVRRAEQVELVDMTPEALRRRMVHGNVYPPDRIDVALTHYFRPGNLTALRELALLWVADRVEEGLRRYRVEHGIETPWETTERIVLGLAGVQGEESLVRRTARIAERTPGSELVAVHVACNDGRAGADTAALAGSRALVESLGGRFHQVVGEDVAEGLLQFARAENATQIVLGGSRRGRLRGLLVGDQVVTKVVRQAGRIDVHILTHDRMARGPVVTLPPLTSGLSPARVVRGVALAAVLLPVLTLLLVSVRGFGLAGELLLYVLAVVATALVGGVYPALLAAFVAAGLADYFFVQPLYSLAFAHVGDVVVLLVFVIVALLVSGVVERLVHRVREAERASVEVATLADLATGALRGQDDLPALLERVRETFGLAAVSLLEQDRARGRGWFVVASAGRGAPERPEAADAEVAVSEGVVLAGRGRPLDAGDRRVFRACATQVAAGLESHMRRQQATEAGERTAADRRRAEVLQAAARDLKPEVAMARRMVEQLRDGEGRRTAEERGALCDGAEHALDRVSGVIGDLLDLSRLHTGGLDVLLRPVDVDEVLATVIDDLGPGGHEVVVRLPDGLPDVVTDASLLTRVIANLVAHLLRCRSTGNPVLIDALPVDGRMEIRLTSRRAVTSEAETAPTGLVPRLCTDLTEAIGGNLRWEGHGTCELTAVLDLPAARPLSGADRSERD